MHVLTFLHHHLLKQHCRFISLSDLNTTLRLEHKKRWSEIKKHGGRRRRRNNIGVYSYMGCCWSLLCYCYNISSSWKVPSLSWQGNIYIYIIWFPNSNMNLQSIFADLICSYWRRKNRNLFLKPYWRSKKVF